MLNRNLSALALAFALAAGPAVAQTAPNVTYFLFIYRAGPSWQTGKPMSVQGLGPHGAYMGKLVGEGVVMAGGPMMDLEGGGLAIVKAKDVAEAKTLLAADPAIVSGIMVADVRTWRPLMGTKAPLLP